LAAAGQNGESLQAARAAEGWVMSSVMSFLKQFQDDGACWRHLEKVRWPDGASHGHECQ
jgi:hypothetical protein